MQQPKVDCLANFQLRPIVPYCPCLCQSVILSSPGLERGAPPVLAHLRGYEEQFLLNSVGRKVDGVNPERNTSQKQEEQSCETQPNNGALMPQQLRYAILSRSSQCPLGNYLYASPRPSNYVHHPQLLFQLIYISSFPGGDKTPPDTSLMNSVEPD